MTRKSRPYSQNPGIVRNRLKVNAAVKNAKEFLARPGRVRIVRRLHLAVCGWPCRFKTPGRSIKQVPAKTPESDAMSKDLSKRGFKFVGSTICYAFMQATGMVNDHLTTLLPLAGATALTQAQQVTA